MSPVEGDKFFGGKPVGKIDSTEPGTTQRFYDLYPAVLNITCDPGDTLGSLSGEGLGSDIKVLRKRSDDGRAEAVTEFPIIFSGSECVIIETTKIEPLRESWTLRHQHGEPEQPPFRNERVPVTPTPPIDERDVTLVPEREEKLLVSTSPRK